MNRLLTVAAALAVLTGCGGGSNPPGDVTVYWGFVRNTIDGPKLYDATDPGGGAMGACDESGVEYVRVTTVDGHDIDPYAAFGGIPGGAIPCVNAGAHGATFRAIPPQPYTWRVTGYRTLDGREVPVAESTTTFSVAPARVTVVEVQVAPIQDDVQILAVPLNANNTAPVSCATSGIGELDVFLWTWAGDQVVSQTVQACGPVSLRLDRDDYEVRLRGFTSSSATTPIYDSLSPLACNDALFIPQLGPDSNTAWSVNLWNVAGATPCP